MPTLSREVAIRRLSLKEFRKNPTPSNLKKLTKKTKQTGAFIYKAKLVCWKKLWTN